jgi:lysophospholipase L1-like esterase
MIGDSVTDCGRARPVGEGLFDAIGNGYVRLIDAHLTATHPELLIRVMNVGCSGNTVRDLKARWDEDVFKLQPDWLTVMIGINDVWRQFDSPRQKETHVPVEEYEATLDDLVGRTKPKVKGIFLATPFFIENLREDRMRARMDEYGNAARRVSAKHGTVLIDVQAEFDRILEHLHSAAIAWDRVHPNHIGHQVIANAFLKAFA